MMDSRSREILLVPEVQVAMQQRSLKFLYYRSLSPANLGTVEGLFEVIYGVIIDYSCVSLKVKNYRTEIDLGIDTVLTDCCGFTKRLREK